ncbi:MAG: hypothetical protein PWR32_167 [Candidatus Woesearchaeota archaeon]|nr:hypothetical protein [Candidatus Woesearchaeota archaeon]
MQDVENFIRKHLFDFYVGGGAGAWSNGTGLGQSQGVMSFCYDWKTPVGIAPAWVQIPTPTSFLK